MRNEREIEISRIKFHMSGLDAQYQDPNMNIFRYDSTVSHLYNLLILT